MIKYIKPFSFMAGCLLAVNVYAQEGHTNHAMAEATTKEIPAVTVEFIEAMNKMHGPMMEGIKASDPDRAFIEGMIPHHQGAIDMAKIVLKHGKDLEVRKLAEEIIKAQEAEITWMQKWLQEHPIK